MSSPPTGVIFNEAIAQPLSSIGTIQPGAYYQFYLTGTTTLTNVYADGALTSPLSQTPGTGATTANAAGKMPQAIYLNPATTYRYKLFTALGTLIEDIDPYIPVSPPTQAQVGLALYPQTAAEIAAGVTPTNYAYAPGDIRRYGASLTASAAVNTAAIQAAQSGNFGVIYAPAGTFSYTVASVTNCTAYGLNALSKNGTTGSPGNNNTAFGALALANLTGGGSNPTGSTAVGYLALTNSNGATNTAVGDNTMSSDVSGSDNQAFGAQALFSETAATGNNCFGFQCGYYVTGNSNLLMGNYAGGGPNGPGAGVGLTTGGNNVGIGGGTLANLGSGSNNTAVGLGALENNVGGNSNIALGYFAGTHANASNELYIDNQDRGTNANEKSHALIYGFMGATPGNQQIFFNAQLYSSVGNLCTNFNAPTLASAATIAPTAPITFVSGTAAIATISLPPWMGNGGKITLIPTGVFTWTAASNIALAGTAVVSKALDFTYDAGTNKWYPSYIS